MRYVILGNSAAGLTAVDAIRERDRDGPITVVSREPEPAYSRVALPYILSREKQVPQITLRGAEYYEADRVEVMAGAGGAGPRSVAAAVAPHWPLADTRKIEAKLNGARSCFVIGAGFISLLTVSALIKVAGLKYTVVEIADQVMPQLLDPEGGRALERAMREKGIDVLLGEQVAGIERGKSGYAITLAGGRTYEASMIVCGAGVRPNVDFLADSGIEVARGVLVNERQETNAPDVFAAGDCAEGFDFLSGERAVHAIWPTAIDQGRVAGANMAGESQTYPGSLSWNVTELFGLSSASVGEFRERDGCEPIVFHNPCANVYRKLLLEDGRIVGAVVIGRAEHVQDLGVVQAMIRRGTDVSRWRHMLRGERINYGMLGFESAKR